jgi:hypothetical protein
VVRAIVRIVGPALITTAVVAYERTPDLRAIDEAVALGQSRDEAVRRRFHQPYRINIGRPPLDYIDLVTPFRRVELAVEERARLGDRLLRQRDALTALSEHGDDLQIFVELSFHPQNTYVGVPTYVVTLTPLDVPARIESRGQQRIPRFGPRLGSGGTPLPYPVAPSVPSGGEPLTGGTLIVTFDGQQLDPSAMYEVVIEESGKELSRVKIDLARLR